MNELHLKSTGRLAKAGDGEPLTSTPRQTIVSARVDCFRFEPVSASTPRDENGRVLSARELLPFYSERSTPAKDPMPMVLCKRGVLSAREYSRQVNL